jgi:hypothetical protein
MNMGVWQGVAMETLKFHLGPPCPTFYALWAGRPRNGLMTVSGVARPQDERPSSTLLGYPTPYACDELTLVHNAVQCNRILGGLLDQAVDQRD